MRRLGHIKNDYNIQGLFTLLNMYEYNLKYLHWTVRGKEFDTYHKVLEDYYENIYQHIDTLAEYMVSKNIEIPKYGTIASEEDYHFIDNKKEYTIQETKDLIALMFDDILLYISILIDEQDLTPGIKSKIDEMYFYYEKELDFFNNRR